MYWGRFFGDGQITWFGLFRAFIAIGTVIGSRLLRQRLDLLNQAAVIQTLGWSFGGMIVFTLVFVFSDQFPLAVAAFCLSQILRFMTRPLIIIWINANASTAVRATAVSLYWQAKELIFCAFVFLWFKYPHEATTKIDLWRDPGRSRGRSSAPPRFSG